MPFSYAQYAGNGSTTTFSVPFPYLLKAHVKLYTGYNILDGTFATELIEGTDYAWTSGTQVQTTTAPAAGVTLTILRNTPDGSQLVPWQSGSNLIAEDLNSADLQNLYVVQEQQDRNAAVAAQQAATTALAEATADAVQNVLLYTTVANVAGIPAAPSDDDRVEVLNSTGIEGFAPLSGIPSGFAGDAQLKVRIRYSAAGATWQWVDYISSDPDGRYARLSQISNATDSSSEESIASSLAVKTAKDAADSAAGAASAAQSTADSAASAAGAAQSTADAAMPRAGGAFTGNVDVPSANGGPLAGMRNLLINGNPIINQRGYVSGTATSGANQYTLDRWRVVTSGQSITWTDSNNVRTVTAPAGGVEQVIEGVNIISGTYTLSWTGTATATVNGSAVTNGGQVTLTGGSNATVRFSGGTFSLAQLEIGTVATPFEQRSIAAEEAIGRRYFERVNGEYGTTAVLDVGNADRATNKPWWYTVAKRVVPSATIVAQSGAYATTAAVGTIRQNCVNLIWQWQQTAGNVDRFKAAVVDINAEL